MDKKFKYILLEVAKPLITITLNRPEKRNAFNLEFIQELSECLDICNQTENCQVICIKAKAPHFSAGADLKWMGNAHNLSKKENLDECLQLAGMLYKIYTSPKITIAQVQGNVLGGANGIIAACDLAVASTNCYFGFTEARLGIVPATIMPYIIKKIGAGKARLHMLKADIFDASVAQQIGLVDEAVKTDDIENYVHALIQSLLQNGKNALKEIKNTIHLLGDIKITQEMVHQTAEILARVRVTPEAVEGLNAFLDKRKPQWINE